VIVIVTGEPRLSQWSSGSQRPPATRMVVAVTYAAPVGSIEQERMLERFIVGLGDRFQAALAVFAENAPGRGR
jgi:hypothetical protein